MKGNTTLYIGIGVVVVLGIVITVVIVKSSSTPATTYPTGYNPNLYPAGYNPNVPGNVNGLYGYNPQQNSDKAALYTGAASVINKALDTFFQPKTGSSGGGSSTSIGSNSNSNNNSSSNNDVGYVNPSTGTDEWS